ncbi:MAG: sugar-binding domain-containing protein [Bacteroidota bacterium]
MQKRIVLFTGILWLRILVSTGQNSPDTVLQYSMDTPWSDQVNVNTPWPAYPRPQMVRDQWINLNGTWNYAITENTASMPQSYEGDILVPFSVESELSGVKRLVGSEQILWYKKEIEIPSSGPEDRWLLHFGAVDWDATIFLNGKKIGSHKGGYTAFSLDITPYVHDESTQELVVRVWDPTDDGTQARGKQVNNPRGIWYTPVTGIWQTVWLEKVPQNHIRQLKITPDLDRALFELVVETTPLLEAVSLNIQILAEEEVVATSLVSGDPGGSVVRATLPLSIVRPWSPEDPFLYDVTISLVGENGNTLDSVRSYAGLRKVSLGKDENGFTRIMLNNVPRFHMGLLDQGWWPDGLYTPPTEEAMVYDLKQTQALGFNMLRKHVKVESSRFYYHCDRMGLLVWQDMPNGNYFRDLRVRPGDQEDANRPLESAIQFERELKEMIDQFHPFPSIQFWVPFNEGWGQYDTKRIASWVHQYDPSRLVNAPSGWEDRGVGDVIDVHIYPGPGMELPETSRASVLGEFGGLGWPVQNHLWWNKRNWGYLTYQSKENLEQRFTQLIQDLIPLKSWGLSAAVYTQTTDVEGEVNGLMTYDRRVTKLDTAYATKLIAPLYRSAWRKRVHLEDSEHSPNTWKSSYTPHGEDWMSPSYNDQEWSSLAAPFVVGLHPFVPKGSSWEAGKTLYLRKSFYLSSLPDQLSIKHYFPKTEGEIYINGKTLLTIEDRGGRKRSYSHRLLPQFNELVRVGWNTLAVKVTPKNEQAVFDLGIYSSQAEKVP